MMNDDYRNEVFSMLILKDTEELVEIWQKNDRSVWSEVAFNVIEEILLNRLGSLPPQDKPKQKPAASAQLLDKLVDKNESISTKYPYLTGYVGFIALLMIASVIVGFIPLPSLLSFALQIVAGFYAFKFVVKTNVLPHV